MKKTLCVLMIALISLGAVNEVHAGWKMRAFFRDNRNHDSDRDEYEDDIPRKVEADSSPSQYKEKPYREPPLHHLYRAYDQPNSLTCTKRGQ